jgi:hypothetical protein
MPHKVHVKDLQLRVPLNKDYADKFDALKKHFGVQANSEAARLIINTVYKETFPEQPKREAPR